MRYQYVLLYRSSQSGRWGFTYIRLSDGAQCEGQVSGGRSNIMVALTNSGEDWRDDVLTLEKRERERDILTLPYAGCTPEEIRAWVEERLC